MSYEYFGSAGSNAAAPVIYYLLSGGLTIALYILRSLGTYTIAKRRGIRHPWFAWLPVVDQYLLGCISDQYQYVVKGQNCAKRKILLVLSILTSVAYAVMCVLVVAMAADSVITAAGGMGERALMRQIMNFLGSIVLAAMIIGVIGIAHKILGYIAVYDLYRSCDPDNAVIYLILGIVFSVTEPFFIFFSRKKDLGMPPRRPAQPEYIPPQPQYQPPQYRPSQPEDIWAQTGNESE